MIKGTIITEGIAVNILKKHNLFKYEINTQKVSDVENEYKRYKSILRTLEDRLESSIEGLQKESDAYQIVKAHITILNDPLISEDVKSFILNDAFNAVNAYRNVLDKYINMFNQLDNEYIKERTADLEDLFNQFYKMYYDLDVKVESNEPFILYADQLLPSDLMSYDLSLIKGVILAKESLTSHIVILIRELNIPFIINTGVLELTETILILDALENDIIGNPSDKQIAQYKEKLEVYITNQNYLNTFKNKETRTLDNKRIQVLSNISSIEDASKGKALGVDGIGLFRTEYLYIGRKTPPSLQEQIDVYATILKKMEGKKVTIRTFDFGSDKDVSFLPNRLESNPSLGLRAIRLGLQEKKLLKTQLKALLSVQEQGNLEIMIPLVSTLDEIITVKQILSQLEQELQIDKQYKLGMMIETPNSAFNIEHFAPHVDFFSIGTNDLYQYVYAIDRLNESLSGYYKPLDPSFISLLSNIIEKANKLNKPISICGELAGDLEAIPLLLGMGLTSYSMSNSRILKVKAHFSKLSYQNMIQLVNNCKSLQTQEDVIKEINKQI